MAHKIYIKDQDKKWQEVKKAWFKKDTNWRKIKKGWVKKGGEWRLFFAKAALPPGIIIPYSGASGTLPPGWVEYEEPYDSLIIGADTNHPVGTMGGDFRIEVTAELPTTGTHTGNVAQYPIWYEDDGDCRQCMYYGGTVESGAHSHVGQTTNILVKPRNVGYRLIKSTENITYVPKQGCVFSVNNLSSTDFMQKTHQSNSIYFSADSNPGTLSGRNVQNWSFTTNTAGGHHHYTKKRTVFDNGDDGYFAGEAGSHYHTGTLTVDTGEKYKYIKLALWEAIKDEVELFPGVIAMWEGLTPPEGWVLCDGNNNTPDLRNRFIIITDDLSTLAQTGGNNKLTIQTTTNTISHSHPNQNSDDGRHQCISYSDAYHCDGSYTLEMYHPNEVSHSHTSSVSTKSHLPKYYALTFIMLKDA